MGRKKTEFEWERDAPEPEVVERPSRGQLKRDEKELKQFVKQLIDAGPGRWKKLPISEEFLEALVDAHRLQQKKSGRSGFRRQLLRIGSLLRIEDIEALRAHLVDG